MSKATLATGVFPGTFNPPTVAHLAVATAVHERFGLETVDLAISRDPLAKVAATRPTLQQRVEVLEQLAERVGWLRIRVTTDQLIADIAAGYDIVIMGADKWTQIHDISFYGDSIADRDRAIARLPQVAVIPRAGGTPPEHSRIEIESQYYEVSSTRARGGETHLMVPEAARYANKHDVWGVQ